MTNLEKKSFNKEKVERFFFFKVNFLKILIPIFSQTAVTILFLRLCENLRKKSAKNAYQTKVMVMGALTTSTSAAS